MINEELTKFQDKLLQEIKEISPESDNTLTKYKRCGREDKFCQNCDTVSIHYRMYDGDHNNLVFKDGKWKIYMFGKPLCIIRPIHIKAIIDSVKISDKKTLLIDKQYVMFLQSVVEDLEEFIYCLMKNPNVDRLKEYDEIKSMVSTLRLLKLQMEDFNKINNIMDRERIDE